MYAFEFGKIIEACIQYFAGGLILAIGTPPHLIFVLNHNHLSPPLLVCMELLPLMTETGSSSDMWIGVTIGFIFAFFALHGIEALIDYFSVAVAYQELDEVQGTNKKTQIKQTDDDDDIEEIEVIENVLLSNDLLQQQHHQQQQQQQQPQLPKTSVVTDANGKELLDNPASSIGQWDPESVSLATNAINSQTHRQHIIEHFKEIQMMMREMEKNSNQLIDREMTVIEAELLAEQVDESIHQLQYKLDHCRRLLQGSESLHSTSPSPPGGAGGDGTGSSSSISRWLTENKKQLIVKEMNVLSTIAKHLMGHLSAEYYTPHNIQEIHDHVQDMDRQLNTFHELFDRWTWKWKSAELYEPSLGETLPSSLIIPVVIDCFVDGFLIGITIAISTQAGYLLAAANCLEMGSLGMAYSSRLAKCTGSSLLSRQLAVISPPLIMLLASGLGAAVAGYSEDNPIAFVIFVSFGVFALVSLVLSELIIEARHVQEAEEKWWLELFIFLGVYVVIMVEPIF
jgi:zinc transporter ZupT